MTDTTTKTEIVPVAFGTTRPIKEFKVGYSKPYAHIIWGEEIKDGAQCRIIITNVAKGVQVYRRDFTHSKESEEKSFNFESSGIVETHPDWYKQIGSYLMELNINGRRKSRVIFRIVP
ncbi:hypothetical protein ACFL47_09620 [Candidatus Latescibacterota bacterium]